MKGGMGEHEVALFCETLFSGDSHNASAVHFIMSSWDFIDYHGEIDGMTQQLIACQRGLS